MTQQTPPAPGARYQAPDGDVQARKRHRKWLWMLGAIVAVIVIAAVITIVALSSGGGDSTSTDSGASGTGGLTVYEVIGEGDGTAIVTYSVDENFNLEQENRVALPWTKTVDLGDGNSSGIASITAQGDRSITSITCRVIRDGEVVAENTSTGQYAVAACSSL